MSVQQYSKEELAEMSLIEIAYEILAEKKQAIPFAEIVEELKKLLETSDEEIQAKVAQFYTELNIDGRFLCLSGNQWGLRTWYLVDQVAEEIVNPVKAKKKKKTKKTKKVMEDDLGFDDEIEEEVEGFDDPEDLIDDDDLDEDLDDLDDDDDEDLDEDLEEIDDLDEDLDEDLELDEEEFEIDEEDEDLDDDLDPDEEK